MARAGYGSSVEGVHAVAAAVEAGRVETLYVEQGRQNRSGVSEIISRLGDSRVKYVDDVRSISQGDAPQGLVARCRPILPVALDSLAVDGAAVLVLDHIEDPHNIGAVARSAVAAGVTGMVVSERRAAPVSAVAFKASAGALETMPVAVVGSIAEALARLKDLGVWVVGLDAGREKSLFGLDLLTESVAVVIGAEGSGLAQLVAKRCDLLVSIPMAGEMESLNASVSGALAAFEIMRVRANAPG